MKNKNYEWFERGYVFDFATRCLKNYKTGEIANVEVSHYMYGEDGSVFSYENDLDKHLHKCVTVRKKSFIFCDVIYDFPNELEYNYVYIVNGSSRGFSHANDEFTFFNDTLWCTIEEYYDLTKDWYSVYEEDISFKLEKIKWWDK